MSKVWKYAAIVAVCAATACGGGGGTDTNDGSSDSSDSSSSSGLAGTWKARAEVAQDGCHERIARVDQTFVVKEGDGSVIVDTSIVKIAGTSDGDSFTASFEEVNGDCVRDYQIDFSDVQETTASVTLSARSNCSGSICENKWVGTATRGN